MICPVSDIFDVRYGHSLELNALEQWTAGEGVAFVSRQMGHNGISAYVKPIDEMAPAPAGDISCALGGNGVLTTYVQEAEFYCGRDVAVLRPKVALTKQQILFYCLCIKLNRYRYSYGRQANKTLSALPVPPVDEIPTWVNAVDLNQIIGADATLSSMPTPPIEPQAWQAFRYDKLFDIKKDRGSPKPRWPKARRPLSAQSTLTMATDSLSAQARIMRAERSPSTTMATGWRRPFTNPRPSGHLMT